MGRQSSHGRRQAELFESNKFVGMLTSFESVAVLKGKAPDSLKVIHFLLKPDSKLMNDVPGLVSFLTTPNSLEVHKKAKAKEEGLKKLVALKRAVNTCPPEYLLFLKKRTNGRFEAVSGQIDPDSSVRIIAKEGL